MNSSLCMHPGPYTALDMPPADRLRQLSTTIIGLGFLIIYFFDLGLMVT